MHPFTYHRAASLADAAQRRASDPEARLLGGGMSLLPSMKLRLAAPSQLIDVSRLPELRGISRDGAALVVGAATTHREVSEDPTVRTAIPALAVLAASIGDPQVRARGTLGGSVAGSDPAADYPAAVLALGARIVTDRRTIEAERFFLGMFETALAAEEIVTAVRFACPRRAAYGKFAHPASGYAMAGVFVAQFDRGASSEVRVAVTGAGPCVFRWPEAEQALQSRFSVASLRPLALPAEGLNADLHAPAEYRAQLARVMAMRAVAQLTGESA